MVQEVRDEFHNQKIHSALELLLELLGFHPSLDAQAPLMQAFKGGCWKDITRNEVTYAL